MARITFAGAAGEVTGSRHLLEINGKKILLDCGTFQGHRSDAEAKNRKFLFDPEQVDAVILSHAHVDHTGSLPLLVKQGFNGPIFATPATAELAGLLLADSAHLQEMDALFFNKKNPQHPITPIYTAQDVAAVPPLMRPQNYYSPFEIFPGIRVEFIEAGHILGSAQIAINWSENGKDRRFVFTGDIGRKGMPIVRDPANPKTADFLVMESTYGNRLHDDISGARQHLQDIIARTIKRGGKVLIPAFAVGRAQEIAEMMEELHQRGEIGQLQVFVDSPLASKTTGVFARHADTLDEDYKRVAQYSDPFGHGWVHYVETQQDSMKLNEIKHSFVIIAPSGMCEGGRILHHLRNNIGDARNTVILAGFQAEGTLGRKLSDGIKDVLLFGMPAKVRAEVTIAHEYSAHADWKELGRTASPGGSGARRTGRFFRACTAAAVLLPL